MVRLLVVALLLFGILGCRHLNQHEIGRLPSNAPREPTFLDVVEILKDKPATVAETLQRLHERFPEFFHNYVLVYHSQSEQQGSYLDPRAIVYSLTGRFVLTFNGNANQHGGGAIELMEITPHNGVQLREIEFVAETKTPSFVAEDIDTELSTAQFSVSKANAGKCMGCHGFTNTHPILDAYFLWPGIYGSNDDNVFRKEMNFISLNRGMRVKGRDPERDGLLAFRKNRLDQEHPRYTYLRKLNGNLQERNVFHAFDPIFERYNDYWQNPEKDDFRPVRNFTKIMYQLLGENYAQAIIKNPETESYRFAIMAAFGCNLGANNFEDHQQMYLPREFTRWHDRKMGTLAEVKAKLRNKLVRHVADRIERMQKDFGDSFDKEFYKASVLENAKRAKKEFSDLSELSLGTLWLTLPHAIYDGVDRSLNILEYLMGPYRLGLEEFAPNLNHAPDFESGYTHDGFSLGVYLVMRERLLSDGLELKRTLVDGNIHGIDSPTCTKLADMSMSSLTKLAGDSRASVRSKQR